VNFAWPVDVRDQIPARLDVSIILGSICSGTIDGEVQALRRGVTNPIEYRGQIAGSVIPDDQHGFA